MLIGLHLGAPRVPLLLGARVDLAPDLGVREGPSGGVVLPSAAEVQVAMDLHLKGV